MLLAVSHLKKTWRTHIESRGSMFVYLSEKNLHPSVNEVETRNLLQTKGEEESIFSSGRSSLHWQVLQNSSSTTTMELCTINQSA